MITSTIKFSQLEDRIDAEYYKPEYLEIEKLFSQIKRQPRTISLLDALTYIKGYAFESEYYAKEGDIGIYRVSNIENGVNLSDIIKVPSFFWEKFKKFRIRPRDIIMTVTGNTVGKAILMPDRISPLLINQNAAIWRTKGKVNQFYLYVFITAKPFQTKIKRIARAGTRPFIGIDILKETFIPFPPQSFQQKIEKMVKESQRKRKLADEKYKEAEEILNKELGLENLDLSTQKTFEAKFSETKERIDPEYYQPKYYKFWKMIRKRADLKKLQDIISKIDYGTVPTSPYVSKEQGIPYIKGKDIKPNHIILDSLDYLHKGTKYLMRDKIVKENDILITQMGTVGNAAVIPKEAEGFAFGSFILRIRLKDFSKTNPYYIAAIVNSLVGKLQIFREMRIATVRANTDIPTIKNLQIPILPRPIQQKISSLIRESFKLRREAKELIEEAKREVEEMVEEK